MSNNKNIFAGLAVSVFGVGIALVVIEVLFRFFSMFQSAPPVWSHRPAFYYAAEKNETLQDYAYPAEKPAHEFRIAVVGDSYTFAPYMQFTDAFPKVLERMLNLNDVQTKARVINYGVPAYSTSHEVSVTERAIKEGADLIILQVTLNDAELKPYRPTGIGNFADKFGAYQPSGILKHWKSLQFVLTRLHNSQTYRAYADYFIDLFENPKSWKVFEDSSKAIITKSKERNIPIVAVVFPLFGTPLDAKYPFHGITQKIISLFDTLKIPSLDLFEPYKNIPLDVIQVIPGVDRHPNELGHRIAGEQIYLWLEKQGLLPEELKIKKRYKTRTGIANMPKVDSEGVAQELVEQN